ncbi:hypothetical protein IKF67_01895 [Candidatus Saccharibacteria bacterium]|nr:hypothetical protein [Candidatus Saccharibacteria bacterium]
MQYEDGNTSPLRVFFRKKWVRLVLIADVLIIIAIIVAFIIKASRVSTLNFNVTPLDATISVNGDTSYSNGAYSVSPGTYQITISHPDLETKTFTVNIDSHYVSTITTFLTDGNNNFDFYKLKENYGSLQKLIEIASAGNNTTTDHDTSAEDFIKDFKHILSIYEKLPIKDYIYAESTANASSAGFAIREGKDGCEMTACLLVNYYGENFKDTVLEKIKEAGYNPSDYQILYERYNQ